MKLLFTTTVTFFVSLNILAQSSKINTIVFTGIERTKTHVVKNELDFKVDDILLESELDSILNENAVQLYNLQLFHWVKYKYTINNNQVNVEFIFQERWYLWPIPIFSLADRNISSWLQKLDFDRLDYGLHFEHENFRGRNEKLKSNIQLGYNQKYELFYTIPYVDHKQLYGLNFGLSHFRSHFSIVDLDEGRPLYKEFEENFAIKNSYIRGGVFRRKNVNNIISLITEYHNFRVSDSLNLINSVFFENEESSNYVTIELFHTLNKRNTFSYPKSGYFLEYKLNQRIGVSSNKLNLTAFDLKAAIYQPISKKLFFGTGISATLKLNKENYFLDQRILGYQNYVRGYEFYVTQGNAMILHKNSINLSLLENKIVKFNVLKSEKFNRVPISLYLSAFGDWAYVHDKFQNENNILADQFQFGTGIGIHLVTYYDRVLVFEYSFNNLGNSGFFISNKFPF